MSGQVRPTTFRKWFTPRSSKRDKIDDSGPKIVNILQATDHSEGDQAWDILADLPEIAFITKNPVFSKEFTIIHHAKAIGQQIFGEERKHFAISGFEDVGMPVTVNIEKVGFKGETKVPSLKHLLGCNSVEKLEAVLVSRNEIAKIPNVLPLPPFLLEVISSMETPLLSEAFVLIREALAKRDRMVSAREAPTSSEGGSADTSPPPIVEKTDEAEK